MSLHQRLFRWVLALGAAWLAWQSAERLGAEFLPDPDAAGEETAPPPGSPFGTLFHVARFVVLLLVAAVLVAPDVIALLSAPVRALVDAIYFPRHHGGKPPLSYQLADFYGKEERHTDALEAYEEILRHYPDEPRAYRGALELLVTVFGEKDRARRLYQKARRRLRHRVPPAEWAELEALWTRLRNEHGIR
ncbi:MAG: hypothetical protein H7A52_08570 [Akkermansiaceae bacterium]|nr:hypothetical protein [Akkermansiaceae bacterium]